MQIPRIPVYIAHPLGIERDVRAFNIQNAKLWVVFLTKRYSISPVADWIILNHDNPMEFGREVGLFQVDKVLVKTIGRIILCGNRISEGMSFEKSWSLHTTDLTGLKQQRPPSKDDKNNYIDIHMLRDFDKIMYSRGYSVVEETSGPFEVMT